MRFARETYIETGRTKFYTRIYRSAPEDSGREKIVLVHGLGMSGSYLYPLAKELSDSYTVYVPDLPGFGKSSKPPHVLTIQELADALNEWAHLFPVEKAWYLGNSIGCQIIVDFTVRYSYMIKGAMLQGSAIDPYRRSFFRQLVLFGMLARYEPASLMMILLKDYLKSGIKRVLKTLEYAISYKTEDFLPLMKVPAVVIWGENDVLVSQKWSEEAASLIPLGNLKIITGESHTINYTNPQLLAKIASEFISSKTKKST